MLWHLGTLYRIWSFLARPDKSFRGDRTRSGGRYWDRISDLFGVNEYPPERVTCGDKRKRLMSTGFVLPLLLAIYRWFSASRGLAAACVSVFGVHGGWGGAPFPE